MDKQEWQIYGDRLGRTVKLLRKLPITVVCTAHRDWEKDDQAGYIIEVPGLKGANKVEAARHFDVVLYSHVTMKQDKASAGIFQTAEYMWQTKPDERRPFAKDRLNLLPAIVPQDLGNIIRLYREHGIQPKILIIGDSGTGKTWCFRTINTPYDLTQAIIHKENSNA